MPLTGNNTLTLQVRHTCSLRSNNREFTHFKFLSSWLLKKVLNFPEVFSVLLPKHVLVCPFVYYTSIQMPIKLFKHLSVLMAMEV